MTLRLLSAALHSSPNNLCSLIGLRSSAFYDIFVGSHRSKVGERVRPFLVTSVAVLVAMVKLVVRMGNFFFSGVGSHLSLI